MYAPLPVDRASHSSLIVRENDDEFASELPAEGRFELPVGAVIGRAIGAPHADHESAARVVHDSRRDARNGEVPVARVFLADLPDLLVLR